MAHGRKRSFIGGLVLGWISLGIIVSIAGVYYFETCVPSNHPIFPVNARETIWRWARLAPLPSNAKGFSIETTGGMFTREFSASFFGEPEVVKDWVSSCPGILDTGCEKTQRHDGAVHYHIKAGDGAAWAELLHHPQRGTVAIRTYWS